MENLETKIPLCMWKTAALSDEQRRAEGASHATFAENSKCALCDGYNNSCPTYEALINNPRKIQGPIKTQETQKSEHPHKDTKYLTKILGMSPRVLILTPLVYAALC